MSSRASTSRCHGSTPRLAQPWMLTQTTVSIINLRMKIPWSLGGLIQQIPERRLVRVLLRLAKSQMCFDHLAGAIEDEGTGHALNFELLCEVALRIENDFEFDRHVSQEAIGIGTFRIHIHADDRQAAAAITFAHGVEPGDRLTARLAPRSPEIHDHHVAAMTRDVERL